MIDISEKSKCCGCHACYNVCPKKAITMQKDDKGFEYPIVDKEKCVKCGLCIKVCPILNKIKDEHHDIKAYACFNKNDDERLKSSSGGIFVLLAKEIISRGGVVFGASFDEKFNVHHDFIDQEKDIEKFMTSKYVQSKIGDTYKKVKEYLLDDRFVLFTGTPCQIEGLKAYLVKDYDKLYTQDIICHGVPSPKVWEKYLDYRKSIDKETPVKINFRKKDNGWNTYAVSLKYTNKEYKVNHRSDIFMQAFLRNTCLRDSCYNCSFKKKYRNSDITLGDYWGVLNVHPELNDNKGTSLVIINSNKGNQLFDNIKDKVEYISTDFEKAISYNSSYLASAKSDKKRDQFFKNLDEMSFDDLVKKYTTKTSNNIIKKIINKIRRIVFNR